MIISGHQPVYLPWLGLFHKLSLCDVFVYMDAVQYLSNDWNNRNKVRTPQGWSWLTVPIDKVKTAGKMLDEIAIKCEPNKRDFWQTTHWHAIEKNYKKSPYFDVYAEELSRTYFDIHWTRLVDLCWTQFQLFSKWLHLDRKVVRMSEFPFSGIKDRLILDQCLKLDGDSVVFGINGRNYVDLSLFRQNGVNVYFQEYRHPIYQQRFAGFEPYMCILDLLFNHGPDSCAILCSGNISRTEIQTGHYWEK